MDTQKRTRQSPEPTTPRMYKKLFENVDVETPKAQSQNEVSNIFANQDIQTNELLTSNQEVQTIEEIANMTEGAASSRLLSFENPVGFIAFNLLGGIGGALASIVANKFMGGSETPKVVSITNNNNPLPIQNMTSGMNQSTPTINVTQTVFKPTQQRVRRVKK